MGPHCEERTDGREMGVVEKQSGVCAKDRGGAGEETAVRGVREGPGQWWVKPLPTGVDKMMCRSSQLSP